MTRVKIDDVENKIPNIMSRKPVKDLPPGTVYESGNRTYILTDHPYNTARISVLMDTGETFFFYDTIPDRIISYPNGHAPPPKPTLRELAEQGKREGWTPVVTFVGSRAFIVRLITVKPDSPDRRCYVEVTPISGGGSSYELPCPNNTDYTLIGKLRVVST